MRRFLPLLLAAACVPPDRPGTFVGNPTVEARLAQPPENPVLEGRLEALEMLLGDCDQIGDIPLGGRVLTFEGPLSRDDFQIPAGRHCGMFLVVDWFEVHFEAQGEEIDLVVDDFDLWVHTRFQAALGSRHTLRFGDQRWLADVALVAEPGENRVDGTNPALDEAFWAGLAASGVERADVD